MEGQHLPNRERRCAATLQLRVQKDRPLDPERETSFCKEGHSGSLMLVVIRSGKERGGLA